ncbi:hypothetical protein EDB85DRAFT_1356691 [Lactarius pseudohatsudake]|nr:hypothetical protein EDB85DRAFT_1356691 [Lactarius pseudohatsudake]
MSSGICRGLDLAATVQVVQLGCSEVDCWTRIVGPSAMCITPEAQPNVWWAAGGIDNGWVGGSRRTLARPGWGRPSEKDEKDFDPVVLNDVAAHAPAAQVHAEILGHDMKDEQALEAQGVAVLGVRRKTLKTSGVVRRKMSTDDPTAPTPPSGSPESGGLGWQ